MMTRRSFLENSLKGVASIPLLSMATAESLFASTPNFSDYKAIIILQFGGGNDAYNTFIPTDSTKHADYTDARKKIAIAHTNLATDSTYTKDSNGYYTRPSDAKDQNPYSATAPANPGETDPKDDLEAIYRKGFYQFNNDPLGIHGAMPEFASLYEKGVVSIVSNVGTLVEPTTQTDIANKSVTLPLFLFAHDHQRRAIQTAYAQSRIASGWLGRVADSWSPINDIIGLNMTLNGLKPIMVGQTTTPLVVGTSPDLYKHDTLKDIINRFATTHDSSIFEAFYKRLNLNAKNFSDKFSGVWDSVVSYTDGLNATNSYGDPIFTKPDTLEIGLPEPMHGLNSGLFNTLKAILRYIKLGKDNFGYKRQVFYTAMGGFDFHSAQPIDHLQRLRTISLAISDFYKALEEMGLQDKVLLATTSDFGRTLLSNGDGSDHGWGGHQFIVCGDPTFNGGTILGDDIGSYHLGSSNNFYPTQKDSKGRLIPTTSIEQMFAPILDWFGVNESTMASAFPNLENFRTDSNDYRSAFLSNMFTQGGA